jgi:hypothetical protein
MPNRDELAAEIRGVQDELERLGVRRERINFHRMPDEELETLTESISEQFETRKRFLGVEK